MKELIKIKEENGKRLVSARELHEFLGLSKRFSAWIAQYIKEDNDYMFVKDSDFTSVLSGTVVNNGANRELQDYAITVNMAKEISMITKNEKGKQARQYFIQCEKKLIEVQNKANLLLSIYNGGQGGIIAAKQLTEIEVKEATVPLLNKIEEDRPKVEFTETVLKSSDNILVRELAKVASDEGIKIGQNKLYEKLRKWGYIFKNGTEPYQNVVERGYFVVKETTSKTPYGIKLNITTLVTPLGQVKVIEKLRKELKTNDNK